MWKRLPLIPRAVAQGLLTIALGWAMMSLLSFFFFEDPVEWGWNYALLFFLVGALGTYSDDRRARRKARAASAPTPSE